MAGTARVRLDRAFFSRALLLIVALALLAAGGTLGMVFARADPPPSLESGVPATDVSPQSQPFDDSRTVELAISMSGTLEVQSPTSGVITETSCRTGGLWTSGQVILRVDEQPVLALHTSVPLYRDLRVGDRGSDVAALNDELRRLGRDTPRSEVFQRATQLAIAGLAPRQRASSTQGAQGGGLHLAGVIWLPTESLKLGACDAALGSRVQTGAPLARSQSEPVAVSIARSPADLLPGARLVRLGGIEVDVPGDGVVRTTTAIARLLATPQARASQQSKGSVPLTATLALKTPIVAAAIPPAAIVALRGGQGCVMGPKSAVAVRVLASSLGSSLVTPVGVGGLPERIKVHPPEDLTC